MSDPQRTLVTEWMKRLNLVSTTDVPSLQDVLGVVVRFLFTSDGSDCTDWIE
jgi:hypothetical protein